MKTRYRGVFRKTLSVVLCVAMVLGAASVSMAADTDWSWKYPTSAVSITNDDGTRNVTVTCTNAGFNIGEILGADQPAGGMYGRYDGPIKLWTTDINENPDRYVTNLAYLWCKYNENPAATTSTFPAEQTELSPHEYTLSPVGGTATGQYGRTLAGSGPNTVNKTAVAEYGGIPTVLYSRADIICGSTVSNYEEYLTLMHSDEWKDSEFYMEGDEDYNPIFVEIGTGTITQRVNSMKNVAKAMNEVIENSNGKIVARYGDPEVIANDMEKVIYGTYFYIDKLINDGKLTKKNATWIASRNADDGTYNCTYYWMQICHEFIGDIFNGPAETYTATNDDIKKYTIQELADMDFILCGRGQKANLLADFAAAGYTKDNIPLLMEDMNHTGFDAGWGMGGASTTWALAYPYSWVYAYAEELSDIDENMNPTAMYRYIQEKFCHITADASESVAAASLTNMWNLTSDIDTVPDKTNYAYDRAAIEAAIVEGIKYATENKKEVNGAFECWWDPFYQCSTFEDYVENYTNVDKKSCLVSAGVPTKGTNVTGLYIRTGGETVDTYTYEPATGYADGTTEYYKNYVTQEMFDAYKAGEQKHVWEPDLTAGIGYVEETPAEVTAVEEAIAAIGEVTKDSGDAIEAARAAYDALTDEQKAMVSEDAVKTLEAAEAAYAALPDDKQENHFTDVKDSDYFAEAVAWAVAKDVTKGTSDTTFSPADECTRGQMVTFLYRAAGSPAVTSTANPFTDVKEGAYYYDAVLWAVDKGITNGMSATTFGPDTEVSRGQAVTFMFRLDGERAVNATNPFTDVSSSDYYYNAVLWAVDKNITNGMSATSFGPDTTCQRAHIVTFLYRYLG